MDDVTRAAHRVVMGAFAGPELPDWARRQLDDGMGSVALFGSNVRDADQVSELTAAIHAAGDDVIICTDEEGGDVTRLHMRHGNPFPGNAALGSADDEELTERVAAEIGAELAAVGIDLDLGPTVDVNSNPHNPVIGVRSFGADPGLVARHTRASVRGLQASGVGACVKHFPGHGDTALDSHLDLPSVDVRLKVLQSRELVPFLAAVQAGALAVMTSHVLVRALDPVRPATLSRTVLARLRAAPGDGGLGFTGLLVSDALDMRGASGGRGEPAAAVLALSAGCDLLSVGADKEAETVDAIVRAVVAAVRSGELAEERLLDAAERVRATARTIAGWAPQRARAAATRTTPDGSGITAAALAAAWQGLRVTGGLPAGGLRGATVLRYLTPSTIAVGEVPWGLPPDGAVLAGRPHVDVRPGDPMADLVQAAAGAPVVALVREQHRHPWVAQSLTALHQHRADLVVVEMGWPAPTPVPAAATVHTFGASRANGAAVDALLAGAARPAAGVGAAGVGAAGGLVADQ